MEMFSYLDKDKDGYLNYPEFTGVDQEEKVESIQTIVEKVKEK